MTKEERAEKWFSNIEESKNISIEEKVKICSKISKIMAVIILLSLILECILLFIFTNGEIFNFLADFLNLAANGASSKSHYRGLALVGGILLFPFIVIPFLLAFTYKNKQIKIEAFKIISCNNK